MFSVHGSGRSRRGEHLTTLKPEESRHRAGLSEGHQGGMDPVLQHHPVADQVETEPGPFPLAPDGRIGEPDRRHQVAPRELGQHPGVDLG